VAKATLQEQAIDRTKPFVVGYYEGNTYHEKLTYPLKSMVKNMEERGEQAPWDSQEVR
jgi:hypothetical protein